MLGRDQTLLAIPISATEVYLYADCRTSEVEGGTARPQNMFGDFGSPLEPSLSANWTPAPRCISVSFQESLTLRNCRGRSGLHRRCRPCLFT